MKSMPTKSPQENFSVIGLSLNFTGIVKVPSLSSTHFNKFGGPCEKRTLPNCVSTTDEIYLERFYGGLFS